MDTSGFYKYDTESNTWLYAQNFVWAKNYTLERDGNREPIDGWEWHDKAPLEYLIWKNETETTIE